MCRDCVEGNLMSYYLTQVRGGREGKREERSVYRDCVEGNLMFYYLWQVRREEEREGSRVLDGCDGCNEHLVLAST